MQLIPAMNYTRSLSLVMWRSHTTVELSESPRWGGGGGDDDGEEVTITAAAAAARVERAHLS